MVWEAIVDFAKLIGYSLTCRDIAFDGAMCICHRGKNWFEVLFRDNTRVGVIF